MELIKDHVNKPRYTYPVFSLSNLMNLELFDTRAFGNLIFHFVVDFLCICYRFLRLQIQKRFIVIMVMYMYVDKNTCEWNCSNYPSYPHITAACNHKPC